MAQHGIYIEGSANNTISNNLVILNSIGICVIFSSGNNFQFNYMMNNTDQVLIEEDMYNPSVDSWSHNYWTDYNGFDINGDGFGDTPYIIDDGNTDWYPLMGSFGSFDAGEWAGTEYEVSVVSNSTVSNFQINAAENIVSFNVSGADQTFGFTLITIPKIIVQNMWQNNYNVIIDGQSCAFKNWTDAENTYIYVNYTHSEHELLIVPAGDTVGPDIGTPSRTPADDVEQGQAVQISFSVTDAASSVKNVTLQYTTNNGTTWASVTMDYNVSTSLYEAAIPGQTDGTSVKYRIVAYDTAENMRWLTTRENNTCTRAYRNFHQLPGCC